MDAPDDRDLVRRVRRGEVDAFGDLVRRYQQSVFNVALRVLRNREDAEDLAQDAFIRAYERLDRYDIDRPFGPWVHRLTANLAINSLKRRRTLFELDEERDRTSPAGHSAPEQALVRKERDRDLHAALTSLPAHYRAAIELRHFQEMSYQQIAAALGVPLNTARSHLYRGRRLLAERMERP